MGPSLSRVPPLLKWSFWLEGWGLAWVLMAYVMVRFWTENLFYFSR